MIEMMAEGDPMGDRLKQRGWSGQNLLMGSGNLKNQETGGWEELFT